MDRAKNLIEYVHALEVKISQLLKEVSPSNIRVELLLEERNNVVDELIRFGCSEDIIEQLSRPPSLLMQADKEDDELSDIEVPEGENNGTSASKAVRFLDKLFSVTF